MASAPVHRLMKVRADDEHHASGASWSKHALKSLPSCTALGTRERTLEARPRKIKSPKECFLSKMTGGRSYRNVMGGLSLHKLTKLTSGIPVVQGAQGKALEKEYFLTLSW